MEGEGDVGLTGSGAASLSVPPSSKITPVLRCPNLWSQVSMVACDNECGVISAVSGRSSPLVGSAVSAEAWMELPSPRTTSIGGERGAVCMGLTMVDRRGKAIAR